MNFLDLRELRDATFTSASPAQGLLPFKGRDRLGMGLSSTTATPFHRRHNPIPYRVFVTLSPLKGERPAKGRWDQEATPALRSPQTLIVANSPAHP
ncbi:MAG: hypothetical protein JWN73_4871 [Betaproteobacteria bacterium]|nr:hypothetical protein [Betaproteobacteria bacterium]